MLTERPEGENDLFFGGFCFSTDLPRVHLSANKVSLALFPETITVSHPIINAGAKVESYQNVILAEGVEVGDQLLLSFIIVHVLVFISKVLP